MGLSVFRCAAAGLAIVSIAAACGAERQGRDAPVALSEDFEVFSADERWAEQSTHGEWFARYNGLGRIGTADDGSVVHHQRPSGSRTTGETHAALITTKQDFRDIDLSLRLKTDEQLRTPKPNPWETAWVVWRYTGDDHFYYFSLKTNGWDLGKGDPTFRGEQRFLDSGRSPKVELGRWYTVRVRNVGNVIEVWVDEQPIVEFVDRDRTYEHGHVGLYNEDADVSFDDVSIRVPRTSASG